MARLLDPMDKRSRKFPFEYVPAASVDVRKTWERARAEIEAKKREEQEEPKVRIFRKAGAT